MGHSTGGCVGGARFFLLSVRHGKKVPRPLLQLEKLKSKNEIVGDRGIGFVTQLRSRPLLGSARRAPIRAIQMRYHGGSHDQMARGLVVDTAHVLCGKRTRGTADRRSGGTARPREAARGRWRLRGSLCRCSETRGSRENTVRSGSLELRHGAQRHGRPAFDQPRPVRGSGGIVPAGRSNLRENPDQTWRSGRHAAAGAGRDRRAHRAGAGQAR